ncbi:hypothetical protein FSP39_018719 [Pinctada imbricata]|uniref:Protein broad-minded n=1 Tax=Pinctada imbricata TaxID=66713 RepID=A0AA89BPL6_PINIB|nr:hypothetical protein FSP39_018719 [Pinctada imbricata]
MSWRGLEVEDLVQNLRQMVISFEQHIRDAGNFDQAEEAIIHLEREDENFNRYEFVRMLKKKIDESVSTLIEDEVERFAMEGQHVDTTGQVTLISKITQSVLQSKPFCDMSRKLKHNISVAVEELIRNFDAEFGEGKHRDMDDRLLTHHIKNMSDEEESSCGSSFNQGMLFTNNQVLQEVAEKLSKNRELQTKIDALHSLNQNMPADCISSDHWPQIRKNLMDVMLDPDPELSHLTQKFITRAFATTCPQTREIFTLLGENLITQFQSKRSLIPKVKNGLDVTSPEIVKLIKSFRLLNEFQQETVNYWIRFPDKYKEEILQSTLNLFSIHQMGGLMGNSAQLTPIHFVSLIDPKAQWFIKWMHGNYSRMSLLEMLKQYRPIVVNAVRHCLDFSANRKQPFDLMSDISDNYSKLSSQGSRRTYYAGVELEYAYFIHSVHLLGRLLCFANGRSFFPIKLKDSDEPVTITRLLNALVLVVVDPSTSHRSSRHARLFCILHIVPYEPGTLVTEILKSLCSSEQTCEICLYTDEITSTLLSPVSHYLDSQEHHMSKESTLLHVADIVSLIASSTKGRRHLMYGERKNMFTRTKSSAAHIIAKFTKKALIGDLPREAGPTPSKTVIGAYLYICRQLYNTCEGLLVLYPYDLHTVVAEAWRNASRETDGASTPTPSESSDSSDATAKQENYDVRVWEDTLRDNLLNFASTAKGILLLQQTGAMNECVSYMFARYEKKLQVSKCEKFGYGFMVTQVAATAPGMVALEKTGYIRALIEEIWSVLECGVSDTPIFTPKSWSVDPVDKASHKHLIRLLNVLSSFPAVFEVLAGKPLASKDEYSFREIPSTIADFMDRLIIMDSDAKIHSLFNFEHSHTFGLRVLSVMVSCLDTFLLLQSQYNFQDKLLTAQSLNEERNIIIDMLSIERNYVLVRTYLIGGPTERILPQRCLNEDPKSGSVYNFPLFSSFPVPREYTPNIGGRSTIKQDNELIKFLSVKKPEKGKAWLEKCRPIFIKILQTKSDSLKGNVVQQLLEVGSPIMAKIPEEAIFPLLDYTGTDSALKNVQLTPLQKLGVKIAVRQRNNQLNVFYRYGIHLKVIHTSAEVTDKLMHLLKQCAFFLQQQQRQADSKMKYLHSSYTGFDWFAATVFLIFNGNLEKSWNFLHKFSTLGCSGYLWVPRLHSSVHMPVGLMSSGISPLFSSTGHNIELVLQVELPLVASAFKMSGFTPAQICIHWLKQCFWNYLDWGDICHYICMCIIMGIDYQVYLCVSILKHVQKDIMEHMQTQDLIIFMKEKPLSGFHISNYMKYMLELEKKYRKIILSNMLNISKP